MLEELLELREPFGTHAVQAPRAVSSLAHEPRLLEDVQVLGDRRARHVEVRRDLACAELACPDEGENLPSSRRGDCLQCGFHVSYVSICLRKKQLTFAETAGYAGSVVRSGT